MRTLPNILLILIIALTFSCHRKKPANNNSSTTPAKTDTSKQAIQSPVLSGLYSFGPEDKSFKECKTGREFWVVDSSARLELKYSQMGFEKPYIPVYVELEGYKIKTSPKGDGDGYDSTLVVKKLDTISRDIPTGQCH